MTRNISFVKHAKAKAHTKMTLTDIPSLVPQNYIEEELIEVIPDRNNKPLRRSLFEEFDLDEVRIDQQQLSQEIEKSSDDGKNVWNDSSIKLLIELRREKDNLFASARNKNRLWEDISKEMSKNGYSFNAYICINKWRGLKYQFNKVHDNSSGKVTGKGRLTWKFYDLMNEFLGSTSNVSPAKECLSSTSFGSPVSSTKTSTNKRKTSVKVSESCRQKQKMLKLMEERATRDEKKITLHENLLSRLTEANDIEKKKVELLEKLLLSKN